MPRFMKFSRSLLQAPATRRSACTMFTRRRKAVSNLLCCALPLVVLVVLSYLPRTGPSRVSTPARTRTSSAIIRSLPHRRSRLRVYADSSSMENKRPLRVVITGGTKGLGRAMAGEFLENGDCVLIASRNENRVNRAVADLSAKGTGQVAGVRCDITDAASLEALASEADKLWGGADMWICNAASNGYLFEDLVDTPTDILNEVATTNVLGTLQSCRQAIKSMTPKDLPGYIVLMEGAGTGGEVTAKYAAYGFSKAGVKQLASSLSTELSDTKLRVVTINPGLVDTELLRSGDDAFGSVGRFIVNLFVSSPEAVAEEVVPQLRNVMMDRQDDEEAAKSGWIIERISRVSNQIESLSPITISVLTPKNAIKKLTKLPSLIPEAVRKASQQLNQKLPEAVPVKADAKAEDKIHS